MNTAALDAPRPAPARPADPLLSAPLLPTLLRFALPNMGAMLATALAAIAETAYVGSFGVGSLAGMALVFPLVMFQMMLSAGAMGGGVSSAVSRAFGAGDPARAKRPAYRGRHTAAHCTGRQHHLEHHQREHQRHARQTGHAKTADIGRLGNGGQRGGQHRAHVGQRKAQQGGQQGCSQQGIGSWARCH